MQSGPQILHTFLSMFMLMLFIACNPIEQKTAQLTSMTPVVSSINARTGTTFGGDLVTITGEYFLQGATVRLGTANCTGANVIGTTSITCTTSAHVAGIVGVTVLNPNGRETTLNSAFTYTTSQTVTSVNPSYGPSIGGTAVTITGTGFTSSSTVDFGGASCNSVVFVNSTTLTCVTSAHVVGASKIKVTNSAAIQFESVTNLFTFRSAPTITSVNLNSGTTAGGTNLTINGSGFYSAATVTVGGSPCTSIVVVSGTTITCTTPAHAAGTVDVIVTNTDAQTVTSTNAFTYQAAPTLTSIAPIGGVASGGTTITLTGTGFIAGIRVDLGGSPCTSINIINPTTLTCVTSSHAAGAITATVTNTDNQSGSLALAYTYQSAPTVTSVAPNGGLPAGGTAITITGTGFVTGATVTIGGAACAGVTTIVSATTITCSLTPAHAAGPVDITVTNTDTQSGSGRLIYTYRNAPTVAAVGACPGSAVCPLTGALAGGTLVTITGTGFVTGATVLFAGIPCLLPNIINSTTITCTTPSGAGPVGVTVTNTDTQSGTTAAAYNYIAAPGVTGATPSGGLPTGGTSITIAGTGFVAGATVTIGGTDCPVTASAPPTSITCTTPAKAAGTYAVVVTNPDGQSGFNNSIYTYRPAPTVGNITPVGGPLAGGTSVTVNGVGFVSGATVDFGGSNCTPVTFNSSNSLTCTTTAHAAGAVTVTVTNPDTQTGSRASGYTYGPAPTVSAAGVSPATGALAGNTNVTITGTGFVSGATVDFGGSSCSNVQVTSATTITCTTTSHAPGAVTVTVTNPDTQNGSQAAVFTYQAAPSVTSAVNSNGLNRGSTGGGTTPITVSGLDIRAGATVTIGGVSCATILVTPPSTITCTLGTHAAGTVDVVITNTDGQTGTLTNGFIYQAAPTLTTVTPGSGGVQVVSVVGTGFDSAATVTFDGVACSVSARTATTLTCTTAAHATGGVPVIVTNSDGQTSNTLATGYTYTPAPTVTSLSVASGPTSGGTSVTITGTNFVAGAAVTFGTINCPISGAITATTITCVTGSYTPLATSSAALTVTVTNLDGQSGTLATAYTYLAPPTITNLSESVGAIGGGRLLLISGAEFQAGVAVTLGGSVCTPISNTSTVIQCTTPAHALGAVDVVVTNPDGQSATLTNGFTYQAAPTVTTVSPNAGASLGGTILTITGTGFATGATVDIGGSTCGSVSVSSSTSLTCTTAAHVAATSTITVTNVDTQAGTLAAAYTYQNAPSITSISPANGGAAGGTTITITGTDFLAGASVAVGGSACSSVTVVSATSITCLTPNHSAGAVSVIVTNSDTQTSNSSAFTYIGGPYLQWITGTVSPNPPNPDPYGSTNLNVTHTFTLKNTGDSTVTGVNIFNFGTDPGAWSFGTNNCTTTLIAGASCTVQLTFLGAFLATGAYSATLRATGSSGVTTTDNLISGSAP